MKFYTCVDRYRNDILLRGYRDGERMERRIKFKPTLYPTTNRKETLWESLDGRNVEPMTFDTMAEANEFLRRYEGVEGFKVYGQSNFLSQFVAQTWPEEIPFDRDAINVTTIDIEVESEHGFPEPMKAEYPIISITLKNNIDRKYYVFGIGEYTTDREDVLYVNCKDEVSLLNKFIMFWSNKKITPDVITGWNVEKFDMVYLINRIRKILDQNELKKLSPWNIMPEAKREGEWYNIHGIQTIDYLDAFKKFCSHTYGQQESYRLDYIANVVLGDRKLSYEDYGSLHLLYKNDFQRFIDYNIKDVELVDRLEEKLGLITLIMTMAYKGGVNYNTCFGTTEIWDSIIHRVLNKNKIAVPPKEEKIKGDYPGGYVKEVRPSAYEWICSFDLNSLYPNILVQWNMSPETIVNNERKNTSVQEILNGDKNTTPYAMAASGTYFKKENEGVIPAIVKSYYAERVEIKKKLIKAKKAYNETPTRRLEIEIDTLNNHQTAIKVLMNSLYGALGNRWFRYFDQRIAEAVTLTGQLCILTAEKALNGALNNIFKTEKDYVVAIDTDSLYVDMSEFVKREKPKDPIAHLAEGSKHLETVFDKAYSKLYEDLNCYENRMEMKREVVADRGIWLAKKRYILNVHDSEGVRYKEPSIKIMGIEAIKSSTPAICREKFKEIFKLIMSGNKDQVIKFIDDFKTEFKTLPPEDVAFPRGVSNVSNWKLKQKGLPIHVRAALLFNDMIKRKGIRSIEPIKNGTKIKFTYMIPSYELSENVFGFTYGLPKEFGLHRYIDYDTQFSKGFMEPLNPILNAAGIYYTNSVTLDDFFA